MHIVSRSVQRPRAMILPRPVDATGAAVESLMSWFKALCEANQLAANVVMTSVVLPLIRDSKSASRLGVNPWASDRLPMLMGTAGTIDICRALTLLSGADRLDEKTFLAWNAHCATWPLLLTTRLQRWCPSCYTDDLERHGRPYDRLLWNVEGVAVCTVHQDKLLETCLSCGRGGHRNLSSYGVTGFCRYCTAWLGKCPPQAGPIVEHETRYEYWTAHGIADILEHPTKPWKDSASTTAITLNALCDHHHGGEVTDMGRHLNRGKGTVWAWLHGNIRPNTEALQTISFAYQLPMYHLLLGNVKAVKYTTLFDIPRHRSRRRVYVRSLVSYGDADVVIILQQVARNPQDTKIKTLGDLGKAVGRSTRDLRRRFPSEMALAKTALEAKRQLQAVRRHADRCLSVDDAIALALDALPPSVHPSRRRMVKLMATQGATLTYKEQARLPAMIQEVIKARAVSRESPVGRQGQSII